MPSLYLLEPSEAEYDNENSPFIDHHSLSCAIVRAHSPHNARVLVSRVFDTGHFSDEIVHVWRDENRVRVRRLAAATGKEKVLSVGWAPSDP